VQIVEVDRNTVYFSDDSDFNFHAKVDSGVNFEFIPVDKGWFNATDGGTYMLCRVPARQWKRGIHMDNTVVYDINSPKFAHEISFRVLASVFADDFDNWGVRAKPPYAISKHFAVDGRSQLYFFNVVIGELKGDTLVLNDNMVYQELQDAVKRSKYDFKVVVNG
jgi:hypothetical protein